MRIANSWIEGHAGKLSPRALHLLLLAWRSGGEIEAEAREIAEQLHLRGHSWPAILRRALEELIEQGEAEGKYLDGHLKIRIVGPLEGEPWTIIALADVLALSSPYSLRLYLLSRQYLRLQRRRESPDRWQSLLGHRGDIRSLRRAMLRAIKEIESSTPLRIKLHCERRGRAIRAISLEIAMIERATALPPILEAALREAPEIWRDAMRNELIRAREHYSIERLLRSLRYTLAHEPKEPVAYLRAAIRDDWGRAWEIEEERKRRMEEERKRRMEEERKRRMEEERKRKEYEHESQRIDAILEALPGPERAHIEAEARSALSPAQLASPFAETFLWLELRKIIQKRYLSQTK